MKLRFLVDGLFQCFCLRKAIKKSPLLPFFFFFLKVTWGIYWELLLGYAHIHHVHFVTELAGQQSSGLVGLPCKFRPLQLAASGSFSRGSEISGLPAIHPTVSPQAPIRDRTVQMSFIPHPALPPSSQSRLSPCSQLIPCWALRASSPQPFASRAHVTSVIISMQGWTTIHANSCASKNPCFIRLK